ncbi:MAG: hypothetical protein LAP40_15670 [Acidobacteriia bacterium]|nr:hypothetical protein [Terriglobia bacterium]
MSRLADLKAAASRSDVAQLLHTTLKGLTAILYTTPIANRYTTFEIPKRGGGTRTIKAPDEKLKLLQQKLSMLLQDCVDEINDAKFSIWICRISSLQSISDEFAASSSRTRISR